jgi:hypothetical protein
MTFNKTLILITALIFLKGCATTETPKNAATVNGNTNTANSAVVETNTAAAFNTTRTPDAPTTNNAPTLAPVVTAYYNALKSKDDAALRKIFSQATLKTMEADMKADEITSLYEFITATEQIPAQPFEVRNEQIQGDKAVAEIRGGSYPNGIRRIFVKENGEWKMTNDSPAFQPAGK